MSDFLALDWETHQLTGLEATTGRQGASVRKAFLLNWPDQIDLNQDTQQAAAWLKEQLAAKGISARSVLLSLPRDGVVVRRLTVPNAPDDELPALVQMQAATKSSTPIDQLELDFLPLSKPAPDGGREVLMWTMPKKKTAKLRAVLEGAGLELQSIGISSVATAEWIAHEEQNRELDPEATSLIIARHGHRVEISILQNQCIVLSHSTQIHSDDEHPWGDESLIVSEIRRTMVSLHSQGGRLNLDRAWLVGKEENVTDLAKAVRERLNCETIFLNPETTTNLKNNAGNWPEPLAAYAGPVGLLLSRGGNLINAVDFQNPRKQRAKRDIKKIRMMAAAVAAAVLLIGAMGYRWWKVNDLEDQRTQTLGRIEELKELVQAGQPTMKAAGLVGEWDQKATKDLGQLAHLQRALPGTDLIYLVDFQLSPGPKDSLGHIQAVGRAKAEADVRELFGKLAERGIKVKPTKTEQSTDSAYPVQFTLDLELPLPASESAPASGRS